MAEEKLMCKFTALMVTVISWHLMTTHAYGWSPWNLLLGPQYKANSGSTAKAEYERKLSQFIDHDLPQYYPVLIKFLGEDNALRIFYKTQFGEDHHIDISNNTNDGIVIKTTMEFISNDGMKETVTAFMLDRDKDSKLDSFGTDIYQPDDTDDDAWEFIWYTSLAIAIKNSGCCNK